MTVLKIGIAVFILVFLTFFYFVYKGEREEKRGNNPLVTAFFVSFVFGLIISLLVVIISFLFFGSVNVLDGFLHLDITQKQIFSLLIGYLLFNFFLENLFMAAVRHIVGTNRLIELISAIVIRFIVVLGIGTFLSINQVENIIIAICFIMVTFLLEYVSKYIDEKQKNKTNGTDI